MKPTLTIPTALEPILHALQTLEPIFHSAHLDASTEKFQEVVAPEFWEVGASGNLYSRDFALKVLAERKGTPDADSWKTTDWHIAEAGHDSYLLTYTLIQPARVTRRLSVWRLFGKRWQVIYHQGTIVQGS